jgi:hypothetical protein
MPKAKDNEIVVGSEVREPSAIGNTYRVIKLDPTGRGQHTTLQLNNGLAHTWYCFFADLQWVSNPPAAVGDLVNSGAIVYEVISYHPPTDAITIQVTGSTSDPRGRQRGGGHLPTYTYTRADWPAVLKPFEEKKEPKKALDVSPWFIPWDSKVIGGFFTVPTPKQREVKPGQRWRGTATDTIYTVESVGADAFVKFAGKAKANDPLRLFSGSKPTYVYVDDGAPIVVPSPSYIPAKGDRVRITEVYVGDVEYSGELKGKVVLTVLAEASNVVPGFVYLEYAREYGDNAQKSVRGDWLRCRLEKVNVPARKVGQKWRGRDSGKTFTVYGINERGYVKFRLDDPYCNSPETFDGAHPLYTLVTEEAPVFIPKKGDKVKITECFGGCGSLDHPVGSIHTVDSAGIVTDAQCSHGKPCLLLWTEKGRLSGGIYGLCELVKEEAKPAAPAASRRRPLGQTHDAIDKAWHLLGPNARELLADIAERLVIGKAHGDFEKALDWTREAYEEDMDGIVYRAARLRSAL